MAANAVFFTSDFFLTATSDRPCLKELLISSEALIADRGEQTTY